jgi:hypothetical protein
VAWVRAALLAAFVYPVVGVTFALPHTAVIAWRLAAWLASAVTFGVHLGYEHARLRSSPLRGALHCSSAVALGAFLLAVWINARLYWTVSAHHSPFAPLALIAFPVVTGVPAFLAGLAVLALVARLGSKA